MTKHELDRNRLERWRLRPELAPNDEKEIRSFLKEMGYCYTYHVQNEILPSLIQTIKGTTERDVHPSNNHDDPFQEILTETFRSYERQRLFIELNCFGNHPVIVYRDVFIRLFRLHGGTTRRRHLGLPGKRMSGLENAVLKYIREKGGATRRELRFSLVQKRRTDARRLTRALDVLSRDLRIVRGRRYSNEEILWTTPVQWYSRLPSSVSALDTDEALEYLILRFLKTTIASSRRTIRLFFRHIVPSEHIDLSLNSLIKRGLITVDPHLILDGKRALILRS
jgi:hypothetical protein